MAEWYRRKSWTKTDEEEFFAKLARARKDGRAQYLKIQAIELVETEDKTGPPVNDGCDAARLGKAVFRWAAHLFVLYT